MGVGLDCDIRHSVGHDAGHHTTTKTEASMCYASLGVDGSDIVLGRVEQV